LTFDCRQVCQITDDFLGYFITALIAPGSKLESSTYLHLNLPEE
jgi:hypothetical protein